MAQIHKIAAVVIQNDKLLLVKKYGKDVWTCLGGKPEGKETEEEALLREIKEEIGCDAKIISKLGDYFSEAIFDKGFSVKLSVYLAELKGEINLQDPELEKAEFISKDYKKENIHLPDLVEFNVIPACINEGLLNWN